MPLWIATTLSRVRFFQFCATEDVPDSLFSPALLKNRFYFYNFKIVKNL